MYNKSDLKFANIADINTDHYLVFPEVDTIIRDILQRDTIIRNRIQTRPEGVETFRWVEQTDMAKNAGFGDPRAIGTTVTDTPTRVEKLAKIKCIQNSIKYNLFDEELTKNGSFSYILEKDMRDALQDMLLVSNNAIWQGTDTSYGSPTTNQYMGLLTAITATGSITSGTIAQAIKSQVATMAARVDITSFPTAVYMNPMTKDLMDKEENALTDKQKYYDVEVVPGTVVTGVMTCIGILPIITDNRIPVLKDLVETTKDCHKIVLLNENMVVRHYLQGRDVSYADPVVFKLGQAADLVTQYQMVMFDNVVVEYPDKAHCILTKLV